MSGDASTHHRQPPPRPLAQAPGAILRGLGFAIDTHTTTITPLGGGWSGSTIFRITMTRDETTSPDSPDLVLRILAGDPLGPRREAAIHKVVRQCDIPAPEIVAIGAIPDDGGTAMVMPLMSGTPLVTMLPSSTPTDAAIWGTVCGAMLARVHAIPPAALADLALPSWLAWTPPSPDVMTVLDPWLYSACGSDRLLHLDFHPANLLGDVGTTTITAVLDWTNARIGPPLADLARTRSILHLFAASGIPDAVRATLTAFETHLIAAWEAQFGAIDPAMLRAFDAWAFDVQITDLAPKLGMPGSFVNVGMLDTLRNQRDAAIAASLADRNR